MEREHPATALFKNQYLSTIDDRKLMADHHLCRQEGAKCKQTQPRYRCATRSSMFRTF